MPIAFAAGIAEAEEVHPTSSWWRSVRRRRDPGKIAP
jgi:hypothetical protein